MKNIKNCIIIYDITNQNSFNNLNKWYKQVRNMNNSDKFFQLFQINVIYEDQFVTHDETNSYAQSINALLYFEDCSLDCVSIENRFICVCHVFLKKNWK